MACFTSQVMVERDEELQVENAKEYLQIFNRNFQDEMISLSDMYIESVANYFRCSSRSGNSSEFSPNSSKSIEELLNELNKLKDHLEEVQALSALMESALKVSRVLIEKQLQDPSVKGNSSLETR